MLYDTIISDELNIIWVWEGKTAQMLYKCSTDATISDELSIIWVWEGKTAQMLYHHNHKWWIGYYLDVKRENCTNALNALPSPP